MGKANQLAKAPPNSTKKSSVKVKPWRGGSGTIDVMFGSLKKKANRPSPRHSNNCSSKDLSVSSTRPHSGRSIPSQNERRNKRGRQDSDASYHVADSRINAKQKGKPYLRADKKKTAPPPAVKAKLPVIRASSIHAVPWMTTATPTTQPSSDNTGSCTLPPSKSLPSNSKKNNASAQQQQQEIQQLERQNRNLPTAQACPHSLSCLDEELQGFAAYVRLNATECEARRDTVRQLERTAQQLFANSTATAAASNQHTRFTHHNNTRTAQRHDTTSGVASKEPEIRCQIFGSFATLPVCTFQSDIDLALWGVVPVTAAAVVAVPSVEETREPSSTGQGKGSSATTTSTKARPPPSSSSSSSPPQPLRKKQKHVSHEERRLKWKEALAAMDAANETTNGHFDSSSNNSSSSDKEEIQTDETEIPSAEPGSVIVPIAAAVITEEEETTPEGGNEDDIEALCFVIDRVGDASLATLTTLTSPPVDGRVGDDNLATTTPTSQADAKKETATLDDCLNVAAKPLGSRGTKGDKTTVVAVDNSSNLEDSDNDGDSADPMESFTNQKASAETRLDVALSAKRSYSAVTSSKSKDTPNEYYTIETSDDDDDETVLDEGSLIDMAVSQGLSSPRVRGFQVSFFSAPPPANAVSASGMTGPQGWVRTRVVSALASLSNKLRKSKLTKTVCLIKTARVPIIKVDTCFGFEADIAVGGHNGTDTSLYAAAQVEKYHSFPIVVLFLKVLLSQQSLDTPFTGGLGSYKLYVLVAYHVHRHLALGGSDRPGEVLLSFLYRYGCGAGNDRNDHATTRLRQYVPLQAHDGASADLSNVYKLDECIHLFRLCWDRLWERVQKSKQSKRDARKKKNSLLAVVVCPDRLRRDREATLGLLDQSLGRLEHVMNTQEPPAAPPQRGSTTQPKEAKAPPIDPRQCPPTIMRDRTLEEIVAGYGVSVEDLTSN